MDVKTAKAMIEDMPETYVDSEARARLEAFAETRHMDMGECPMTVKELALQKLGLAAELASRKAPFCSIEVTEWPVPFEDRHQGHMLLRRPEAEQLVEYLSAAGRRAYLCEQYDSPTVHIEL